jgi:hypothetical protein
MITLALTCLAESAPAVFLKDSEVFVRDAQSGTVRQLTNDGVPKRLLAPSGSGSRIAFVRDSPGVLADVITMRIDGTGTREIRFRPTEATVLVGMRFVEILKWIADSRFALAGSLDPSTCEYAVIDADSGAEIGSYLTDGFSLVVSPDGNHVAYIGQIPHFMPEERRRPQFCLDDECVFDQPYRGFQRSGAHLEYRSSAIWSPDSSAVAIAANDYESDVESAIVRRLAGKHLQFTAPTEGHLHLSWDDRALVVLAGNQTWRLDPGRETFSRLK